MFSQVAIVVLGIFLVAMGLRDGNYLNVGVGILVAAFAISTLYKLKSESSVRPLMADCRRSPGT